MECIFQRLGYILFVCQKVGENLIFLARHVNPTSFSGAPLYVFTVKTEKKKMYGPHASNSTFYSYSVVLEF